MDFGAGGKGVGWGGVKGGVKGVCSVCTINTLPYKGLDRAGVKGRVDLTAGGTSPDHLTSLSPTTYHLHALAG